MLAGKRVGSIQTRAGEELGWVVGYLGGPIGHVGIVQWLLFKRLRGTVAWN